MGEQSNKRTIKAIVVSSKMDKTIVVRAQRLVKHRCSINMSEAMSNLRLMMRKIHATWAIRF